jgi:hypothetical protein
MTTGDHAKMIRDRLHDTNPDSVMRAASRPTTEVYDDLRNAMGEVDDFMDAWWGFDFESGPGPEPEVLEGMLDWALVGARAFLSLAIRFSYASDPSVTVGPPTEVPDR